jgi:Arc/MetJ-type ribon-helix-helix transcriptional regulator
VFDKAPNPRSETPRATSPEERPGPEDERIALRCNRKELQLLDSFVANGEFASRSELMRAALREFLRVRALSGAMIPGDTDAVEVPVTIRRDEYEQFCDYGDAVANGLTVENTLALMVRRGALENKVAEQVAAARESRRRSVESREKAQGLERARSELTRRGVIGR